MVQAPKIPPPPKKDSDPFIVHNENYWGGNISIEIYQLFNEGTHNKNGLATSLPWELIIHVPRKSVFTLKGPQGAMASAPTRSIFQNIPASAPGEFISGSHSFSPWLIYRLIGEDDRWDVSSVMLGGTPSRFIPLEGYLIGYDRAYFSCIPESINGHAIATVQHQITLMAWCGKTRRRWGGNKVTPYMYL